jgi:iron complex transport system ATP-binding protein
MNVYDLVSYGRYPYVSWNISLSEKDHQIIQNSIKQLRIGALLDKQLFELSDGQLQMVMIAKALAQDTPVMILDEPTAHLDLNNRVEIMNILRDLSRSTGKAILLATHELDLALQTADKIWLAAGNSKIFEGMPEDLVLNGTFDEVFQFKGFDLKTGKIHHQAHRHIKVNLVGEGHEFLWTKNALERNGYEVTSSSPLTVKLHIRESEYYWSLGTAGQNKEFSSLEKLLKELSLCKDVH